MLRLCSQGTLEQRLSKKGEKNKISDILRQSYFEEKISVYDKNFTKVPTPVGRLRSNLSEWERIGSNSSVIQLIKVGYRIPFKTEPESVLLHNNKSALNDPSFVQTELENLVAKGCISCVTFIPKVVNPLTVAYNRNGKPRLVLDCRHVNPHLHKFKYRYEDATVAREMLKKR